MDQRIRPVMLACAATFVAVLVNPHAATAAPPAAETEVVVRKVSLDVDPANLLVRDRKLYASGFHAGRVSALDLATGKKTGETQLDAYERFTKHEVGGERFTTRDVHHYCGGTIVHAADKLFVEQGFSDTLLVIDPGSMRVVKRLPLGDGLLAATPDGKTIVCARTGKDEFRLVDAETYRHKTVPYPEGGHGVSAVVVSPDGRFLVLGV